MNSHPLLRPFFSTLHCSLSCCIRSEERPMRPLSYSLRSLHRRLMSSGTKISESIALRPVRSSLISAEDAELEGFLDYMEKLRNYERLGVPTGAGTESDDGFDLGRMRRLLHRLGDPHSKFQSVHIAGTKGKGSTAAYLSNILRKEGYSVGCYSSPHLLTIRERISCGQNGEPVSAEALNDLFYQVKGILDDSIQMENGALTHFEIFTALAFALFSREKVDVAIIEAGLGGARDATNVLRSTELAASVITTIDEEHLAALGGSLESIAMAKAGIIKHGRPVVIGGPFQVHIERIIRYKATSMNCSVISGCDAGVRGVINSFERGADGRPHQICDIVIQIQKDLHLFIDLSGVKIRMLGNHQLQNAVTATCTALCLRNQGWKISDKSIRDGLEHTQLLGRSHFLAQKEAEKVGLLGTSVLIDGAHTKESAKGLADTIMMVHSDGPLALIVAMASDKDQFAFARELLSGRRPDIVFLTEVSIAGGKARMTSASALKDAWVSAAMDLGINFSDIGTIDHEKTLKQDHSYQLGPSDNNPLLLLACPTASVGSLMKMANQFFKYGAEKQSGLIVVTGSLHIVPSSIAAVQQ